MRKKRGFLPTDFLPPWLLGLLLLAIFLVFYLALKGKGVDLVELLRDMLRLR